MRDNLGYEELDVDGGGEFGRVVENIEVCVGFALFAKDDLVSILVHERSDDSFLFHVALRDISLPKG